MTYLNSEVTNIESGQGFNNDTKNFGIGNHRVVDTSNVKILFVTLVQNLSIFNFQEYISRTYALIEFTHSSLGHSRLIATIDFGNVISLEVLVFLAVHGQEASKRNL